jgi:transcriptional antiterminator RfaH
MATPTNVRFMLLSPTESHAWFCLRSHPKHELVASAHLRLIDDVKVFCPRLRLQKLRNGKMNWSVESLFPNYLFAHFDPSQKLLRIRHTPGIQTVVKFGQIYPSIPNHVLQELRSAFDSTETKIITQDLSVGDSVQIADGIFCGLQAVITHLLPARERVKVLLRFLGRLSEVEIRQDCILPNTRHPLAA